MSTKPYKGLNPYIEEDNRRFFGRESQIQNIIERFKASRLTILYGESGVGKTSIVRAGVAAQLRKQAQENLSKYKIPFHAVVVFPPFNLSWKDEPILQFKQQIKRDVCKLISNIELPQSELPLTDTLQAWAEQVGGKDSNEKRFSGRLFIILDQFEEYSLYHPPTVEEGTFDYEFSRAIRRSQLPVHFLISIRKDFIAQLDRYKNRLLNLLSNRLELEHLDYSSAREAIVKPIEEYYNSQVAPEEAIVIGGKEKQQKEEFLEEVLKDLISENKCDKSLRPKRIKAPILQLVMERLWEEEINRKSQCLRLETFEALGKTRGVSDKRKPGIAALHVNEKLDALSPREKEIAANIFHYLVTPSGSKQAISPTDLVEYAKENPWGLVDDIDEKELEPLLKKLTKPQFCILQAIGESTNISYEIYHDVLAKPILAWRTRHLEQKEGRKIIFAAVGLVIVCFYMIFNFQRNQISRIEGATEQIELAQKNFEQDKSRQLIALVEAIRFKNELQEPLKTLKWIPWVNTNKYTSAAENSLKAMLEDIQVKNRLVVKNPVLSISFNYDSKNFAVATSESLYLWDLKDNKQNLGKFNLKNKATIAKFNSNANVLAAVFNYDTIRLFDLQNNRFKAIRDLSNLSESTVAVSSVSFNSQNPNTLAIGFNNGVVRLENWEDKENQLSKTFSGCRGAIWSLNFSPNGQFLAAGSNDGNVCLWNWENNQLEILKAHQTAVLSMSFSPNGQFLATGSANGIVRLWNWKENQLSKTFSGCQGAIWSLNFSPNGQLLAAGSNGGNVCLWKENNQLEILEAHQTAVLSMSFSLDDRFRLLATGSADNTVILWDFKQKPSLDEESLDELLDRGCSWIEGYLETNSEEDYVKPTEKEQKLSEQCFKDD